MRTAQKPNRQVYGTVFENRRGWMRPREVADIFGISVKTVYDWKSRPWRRRTPEDLFVKFNGQLLVRTDILQSWISQQAANKA